MYIRLVAYNIFKNSPEKEFNNLGDAIRYVISRNSNAIGIRTKSNGLKIGVARTELDNHSGIGVDYSEEKQQVDSNNPVTHVQIYQTTQALVDFGVDIGDLRDLDMRK